MWNEIILTDERKKKNNIAMKNSTISKNIFQEIKILSDKPKLKEFITTKTVLSVQFSHSVMSNSLRPHELPHARPPCLSPTPGVYSNSCPSS